MTTTTHQTPESGPYEIYLPPDTPDTPNPPRTTSDSESSYFNISWISALKGVPPALPTNRSNITHHPITLGSPPSGLLFKRRLWNRETDHGRLCDPNGWQGSLANQQRLEAQREINEEWLEERGLLPLDASMFREIEWKRGATVFEVQASPRTILLSGGVVEAPWTQAVEAHGSLNNSRRYHARLEENQRWLRERGESPVSVDTFTAVSWYMGSSKQDESPSSSPRGTDYNFPDADTVRYQRSTSSTGGSQYPYSPSSSTADSLSSFADLISRYNRSSDGGSRSPSSSIGITKYPYPSPSSIGRTQYPYLSPDLEIDHSSIALSIDTDDPSDEPVLQTASIALVISPRNSKASMLSAGHASQARRSPHGSETFGMPIGMPLSQDQRFVDVSVARADLRGLLSPEVRLVVIGGKAVRQRQHGMSESESDSKWSRDSLLSPLPEVQHKRCGIWAKAKGMFGKLDCRGVSNPKK